MDSSALIEDAHRAYARAMNLLALRAVAAVATTARAGATVAAGEVELLPVPGAPLPVAAWRASLAHARVPAVAVYEYEQQAQDFKHSTLLTRPEALLALTKIRAECDKVRWVGMLAAV